MRLKFQSRELLFQDGHACLIPSDWEEVAQNTGQIPATLHLQQGEVQDAFVERPGQFQLLLANLSIIRRSDKRAFFVPLFLAPELVSVSEGEIMIGTATISIEPDGPYCVTLFDSREHQPLAYRKLTFSANTSTFTVSADENGDIVFLTMPTLYRIKLSADMGMTIVPV